MKTSDANYGPTKRGESIPSVKEDVPPASWLRATRCANWEERMTFSSHEAYFETVSPDVQPLLASIQAKVETLLPNASRCVSYNMPAFRKKRVFFYFAAFKRHIGVYPPVTQDAALVKELSPYRNRKGNLSFPLNQPLPIDLIGRVAFALHQEYERK
jgi:uncharacterized protein YdhG (YjbR/CyaY superfamily)